MASESHTRRRRGEQLSLNMATTVGIGIVNRGGAPLRLIYYSDSLYVEHMMVRQIECTIHYGVIYVGEYPTKGR